MRQNVTLPGLAARPEPKPGDILLFTNARGLNRMITWFTRSRFYHAAIYAGDGHVIEARPRGVIDRDLRGPEGAHTYAVIPAPDGAGQAALAWAKSQIGAKYDRFDVVIIVLDRIFRHLHLNYTPNDKYSCGEFVARAFQHAGVTLVPHCQPSETVPGDFEPLLVRAPPEKAG